MKFLTVDPGESTGYAVWEGLTPGVPPVLLGTADLSDFMHALAAAFDVTGPGGVEPDIELVKRFRGVRKVIFENWKLYPWKLRNGELDFDECRTARGIGQIEFICQLAGVPYEDQDATIKDGAVAAGAEEHFMRPLHDNRHANDAIMHGIFWKAQKAGTDRPREAV